MIIIALDLEGTLICDQIDPRLRPGLYHFLKLLGDLGARIVMMTTVPEDKFRKIATKLIGQCAAPDWFADVEYISWKRPHKSLKFIPGVEQSSTAYLVDDYQGYVDPNDRDKWIPVETFFDQDNKDSELERVGLEITRATLQYESVF